MYKFKNKMYNYFHKSKNTDDYDWNTSKFFMKTVKVLKWVSFQITNLNASNLGDLEDVNKQHFAHYKQSSNPKQQCNSSSYIILSHMRMLNDTKFSWMETKKKF